VADVKIGGNAPVISQTETYDLDLNPAKASLIFSEILILRSAQQ
jgi:hypothetical protein